MQTVLERIRRHKISNIVYLNNMATQELIRKAESIVCNIVERNPNLKIPEISELAQKNFDFAYPNINQVRNILKKQGYVWNKEPKAWLQTSEPAGKIQRTCMRCDETKYEKLFRKVYPHVYGDVGYGNRLVICNSCILEESNITGESSTELIGVYAYLQQRYKNNLEKYMYRKFWEKLLR